MTVSITAQVTPNPDTLKFVVDQQIIEKGSIEFATVDSAKTSPLAAGLIDLKGVKKVFVGTNFISVTKDNTIDWLDLAEPVTGTIEATFNAEGALVDERLIEEAPANESDDSEAVQKIKTILDEEIRPAVAMDGGDVVFDSYKDGILYLQLQGACSTCPSSTMTLKMGIETRLKEDVPEIQDVVQSNAPY